MEGGSTRKRRIQAGALLAAALLLALAPYGPVLLTFAVLGWAGWLGRDAAAKGADR